MFRLLSTCFTVTVESIGGYMYILQQYELGRAVPELTVLETEAEIEFFSKALSPFCIPVARQCSNV